MMLSKKHKATLMLITATFFPHSTPSEQKYAYITTVRVKEIANKKMEEPSNKANLYIRTEMT